MTGPDAPRDYLLTADEVAAELRIATSTLENWRSDRPDRPRRGPVSFKVGGRVVYRRSVVDAWLAAQEQAATDGAA